MPDDLTLLDVAALLAFGAIWVGYNALFHGRFLRANSASAQMIAVRQAWITRLLRRGNRMMDATLVGHSMHGATVFAFTTLVLLAGLLGVLVFVEQGPPATADRLVLLPGNTQALFEIKVFLVVGILIYAFLKFTSAIHQFKDSAAIIDNAPRAGAGAVDDGLARRMGLKLNQASSQFDAGLHAYYFAFAALCWFVHPILFIVTTVLITLVLVRRQLFSTTAHTIADHAQSLSGERGKD